MKTFQITIDGKTEILKAKYTGNGVYIFKNNKTNNSLGIQTVREIYADDKTRYMATEFYAFSPAYLKANVKQLVIKIA